MTHLDLFSGIGGFALAANRCGYETVGFVERDEFCKRVLRKHWPSVPIFDDIHDFNGTQFKGVKLLTGGFPCQPYSQAGLKRGSSDDRALWPEMLRIITEARPSYIVGENVVGIVNMELDDVLDSLEGENYAAQTFIIPACAVDARHRRDRVWILGTDAMADPDKTSGQRQRSSQGSGQSGKQHQSRHDVKRGSQKDLRSWPIEPDVCRVVDGVSKGLHRAPRLAALGNSIVPQVAEEIIKAIPK